MKKKKGVGYRLTFWDEEDREESVAEFDDYESMDTFIRFQDSCNNGFKVLKTETING